MSQGVDQEGCLPKTACLRLDQHLAGIGGSAINWFPRWKEGKEGVIFSCGDYPNVPLIGTWGCINYNPALAIRQLGYPMRGAPTEGSLSPFLVKDLGAQGLKVIQRIHKAWRSPLRKDKELRGIRNGIIGGYHGWHICINRNGTTKICMLIKYFKCVWVVCGIIIVTTHNAQFLTSFTRTLCDPNVGNYFKKMKDESRRPSGLRKTTCFPNSLALRTPWRRPSSIRKAMP